jgi:hypothetical protein
LSIGKIFPHLNYQGEKDIDENRILCVFLAEPFDLDKLAKPNPDLAEAA